MSLNGAERIAAERQRQIDVEGWTPAHDEVHSTGELIEAALSYAMATRWGADCVETADVWPWHQDYWKPGEPIRNLEKAGALLAAEIDRLDALNKTT